MVHLLICYKNFSKDCNVSHIGLGVTAAYTAKTLCHHGYFAEALPVFGADDLSAHILKLESSPRPVTHVVICAQWIATVALAKTVRQFPHIMFSLNCHSNVGFLQAEPPAINLVRQAIDLESGVPNFHASSNNLRLVTALEGMYGRPVTYLPNLYFLHGKEPVCRPLWNGGLLRIGAFGSARVYKNFSVAVAAGVYLVNQLKCHAEIWINGGRHDGAGDVVRRTAVAWTDRVPNVTLCELPWSSWPDFQKYTGAMNVLMQPSYTETFNNVTADGISQGTPSVVGPSIEWCPEHWKCDIDDTVDCARVARSLLTDGKAAQDGYEALKAYVARGLPHWREFLGQPAWAH